MYDAIIFDLDGTLIDSAPEINRALNYALQDHDIEPFSLSEVTRFIGNGLPVLVERALTARGHSNEGLRQSVAARMLSVYETSFAVTRVYPGVIALLDALAPLPLGICTNKPLSPTRAVLEHFEIARRFGTVVAGDSLPQRKPDPAPLLHAVAALGAHRPLYVGDGEVDAATARAAALPFAFFTGGYASGPVVADLRFDHHASLLPMIRC